MIYGFRAPMIFRSTIVAMMVLTTAHAMAQDETADSVPSVKLAFGSQQGLELLYLFP